MFATISVFALIAAYVAAEVPLIHVCNLKDPKFDQCIVNNINNLKSKICEGLPELDIPPSDPFIFDQLIISNISNSKLYIRNGQVMGACDFNVNYLHADLENFHFDVDVLFDQIRINATSDFDIRLLVPIAYKRQIYITTENVGAKIGLDLKIATKNGKRYMYVAKIKINVDIKGYKIQREEKKFSNQLSTIIQDIVGDNQQEIIKKLKPALEELGSKRVILIINNLLKHFTYDELVSEKT